MPKVSTSRKSKNSSRRDLSSPGSSSQEESEESSFPEIRTFHLHDKGNPILSKSKYAVINDRTGLQAGGCSGKVLKEIRSLQSSTKLLIPKAPFARVVKEIGQKYSDDLRCQSNALLALQEGAEHFLIGFLSDSLKLTRHRKKATLMPSDMILLREIMSTVMPFLSS